MTILDLVDELLDRIDEVTAGCMGCTGDVPANGPSDLFCSPGCQTVALASMGDRLPGERPVDFVVDETRHSPTLSTYNEPSVNVGYASVAQTDRVWASATCDCGWTIGSEFDPLPVDIVRRAVMEHLQITV